MNVLLDTHALIWLFDASPRLTATARAAIEGAEAVYVSAASAWEIATKHRIGKLEWKPGTIREMEITLRQRGAVPLAVSFHHGVLAGSLPIPHADPFDRMLIAQAMVEDLTLVSNETAFDAFGVKRLW